MRRRLALSFPAMLVLSFAPTLPYLPILCTHTHTPLYGIRHRGRGVGGKERKKGKGRRINKQCWNYCYHYKRW
ncbi:hypothetical protein F4811DRAFT_533707 [Daldinia bambusicola]|nr:hypothetical protein F4811DRAFT_533707 [Daldinia bambusicola]